jgi:hypothetical protein
VLQTVVATIVRISLRRPILTLNYLEKRDVAEAFGNDQIAGILVNRACRIYAQAYLAAYPLVDD